MKNPTHLLPALLLLLAALPLAAADKLLLRPHWEPGKLYRFESKMDTEAASAGGGQTTINVIQNLEVRVTKQDGTDRNLLDIKVASIKALLNVSGQLMTYDSTDPAMSQPALQQTFGALVGKSVTAIYDRADKFIEIIVPADFPITPLGGGQSPDGKQFGAMMRDSLEAGLPAEALAVGDPFNIEKTIEMAAVGAVTTKSKGRLESIIDHEGRKHARLISEGTLQLPAPFASAEASHARLTTETLFDLQRKVISLSTAKADVKMNAAGNPVTLRQNTVTTLKSIDPAPTAAKK